MYLHSRRPVETAELARCMPSHCGKLVRSQVYKLILECGEKAAQDTQHARIFFKHTARVCRHSLRQSTESASCNLKPKSRSFGES